MPSGRWKARHARALGDRREDVEERRGLVDGFARAPAARELHEERHLQALAVEEHPVLGLAVLAEALAVVREEDDHGPVVEPARLQERDELSDDGVRLRDLAVVGLCRVPRLERLRRLVRRVGLVEVEECERLPVRGPRREPGLEPGLRLGPRPLDAAEGLAAFGRFHGVVVEVEAARDPAGGSLQDEARDGAARLVALLLEELGERRDVRPAGGNRGCRGCRGRRARARSASRRARGA